ncbi:hypothetical protein DDF67_12620 [Caulobacter endophyticus]|uniref:Uncharacterized protein n=2 Tax=Caulobacter endophyticus TaxID=2172652 RepID=A0A2T9JYP5_9CAUL|nr:hypothetical protein DDF67_12620 [Caulobacter endophyticus]
MPPLLHDLNGRTNGPLRVVRYLADRELNVVFWEVHQRQIMARPASDEDLRIGRERWMDFGP